jgi:hypothetical protein
MDRTPELSITGSGTNRGADAAGLGAGMVVIAGILLGAGVGVAVGLLIDRPAPAIMVGSSIGLVLGFYMLYIKYFKPR